HVTGVQTCALPILGLSAAAPAANTVRLKDRKTGSSSQKDLSLCRGTVLGAAEEAKREWFPLRSVDTHIHQGSRRNRSPPLLGCRTETRIRRRSRNRLIGTVHELRHPLGQESNFPTFAPDEFLQSPTQAVLRPCGS